MNPLHQKFCESTYHNTLEDLFDLIDQLEPTDRDSLCMWTFDRVLDVGYDKPITGDETGNELMKGPVNYRLFRKKCHELIAELGEDFLVTAIVNYTLAWGHRYADDTRRDEVAKNHRRAIARAGKELETDCDERTKESLRKVREMSLKSLESLDEDYREARRRYDSFCKTVVEKLIKKSNERSAKFFRHH